ncbi:MAG: DUF6370 family protein [Lentisphaeraceae bacterium]|nr:DUF6370 family protein [Lentisphaeraceae bacterium]
MKALLLLAIFSLFLFSCSEQKAESPEGPEEVKAENSNSIPDGAKEYEVGCGLCVFDSDVPDACESYLKIDGKVMPVTGEVLDAHEVGLCEYKGTAYLEGEVKDGKFVSKFMKIKEFDKSKNYQE